MLTTRIVAGIATIVVAVVAVVLLLWLLQRRLIYLPWIGGALPHPREAGLPSAIDVTIETEDGVTLGAWFVQPLPREQGWTVILFNGNAGNRALRAPLAARLAANGISVLMCDYRGFAGNPGYPTEDALARDARAALRWVVRRHDGNPGPIAYFGESLGTGVAVRLAAESEPAALILRSPFTSMVDVAQFHYPFLPARWLLRDRYPSIERIGRLSCPILVIAAERDSVIPASQSRRLYDAAPATRRRWLLIPGADHNDFEMFAGNALIDEVIRFLYEASSGR